MGQLLHEAGYSLQANRKTREGTHHPDRNAQFEHINRRVRRQMKRGEPAISVDTKKKGKRSAVCNGLLGQGWECSGYEVGFEGVRDGLGGIEAAETKPAVDAHQDGLSGRAAVGTVR